MPATRSIRSGSERGERAGRIRVRSSPPSKSGKHPLSGPPDVAEISLGRASVQTLRQHKGAVRKVLTTYADAVAKAERLGTPFEVVIKVHPHRADPAVEERAAEGDALGQALAAARRRGAARVAEIMKSPDMLSARAFGPLIGASHETVNQKRKAGEVLALQGTTRGLRYPRWQVTDDGRLLPGLAELTRELPGGPWAVYRFLLQPHNELDGRTGLAALKANRVRQVLDVARSIAQGTFS